MNFCSTNYELKNSIIKFNMDIRDFCNAYANVKFIDFSEFLSDYSKDQWIDWKYYFLSQMVINPKLAGAFRKWFTCKTRELALSRKNVWFLIWIIHFGVVYWVRTVLEVLVSEEITPERLFFIFRKL